MAVDGACVLCDFFFLVTRWVVVYYSDFETGSNFSEVSVLTYGRQLFFLGGLMLYEVIRTHDGPKNLVFPFVHTPCLVLITMMYGGV